MPRRGFGGWVRGVVGGARFVFRISMPAYVRIELVDMMSDVEYRLASGTSEKLQLGALVGAFAQAREGIVAAAAK
jgi:replication factor C subunit 3/5